MFTPSKAAGVIIILAALAGIGALSMLHPLLVILALGGMMMAFVLFLPPPPPRD